MSAFFRWSDRQRHRCLISLITAMACVSLMAIGALADEPARFTTVKVAQRGQATSADDWQIQIVPGPSIRRTPQIDRTTPTAQNSKEPVPRRPVPSREPESEVINADATVSTPHINLAAYAEVYNAIPFSRTEYLANRDYRHEATLEILFGQLRPKTVVLTAAPLGTSRAAYSLQTVGRPGGLAPYSFWSPAFPAAMGAWQP